MSEPSEHMLPKPESSLEQSGQSNDTPSNPGVLTKSQAITEASTNSSTLKLLGTPVEHPSINAHKESDKSSETVLEQKYNSTVEDISRPSGPNPSQLPTSIKEPPQVPESPLTEPPLPSIEVDTLSRSQHELKSSSNNIEQPASNPAPSSIKDDPKPSSSEPSSLKETIQNESQEMGSNGDTRSLRKRKREVTSVVEDQMRPLTEEERLNWPGWAEIESEPALFNYILKGHGVKDIKIKELVMGIEDECLVALPKPVYGLIFLFKYRDDDDETIDRPKCPANVWFANQVATNSCATVAMLNILMNIKNVELGDTLSSFKTATANKKPPFRGWDLMHNAPIRVVHNSFVRKLETWNADLYMENDFEKWQKLRKKPKLSPRKKTSKQKKSEEEGPAFHFIAYVPVHDHVWRMDGMQKNPLNLGRIDGNWLTTARNNIYEQMAKHPDDQTYNFMALCKSPHTLIKSEMASNTRSLQDIEAKLTSINAEWRQFLESSAEESTPPREMDESFGLTPEIIAASLPNPSVAQRLERAGTDMEALIMLRAKLILEEKRLQAEHCEEVMEDSDEADKVKMHLKDYGPDMYKLVKTVLENGTLKAIWDDL